MDLLEAVGDISPGQGSFNARSGKWTRTYYVGVSNPAQLTAAVRRILGRTLYWGANDGKLKRELPAADPQFPWLYAESVSNIVGMGMKDPGNMAGVAGAGAQPTFGTAITELVPPEAAAQIEFGLYPVYALTVEFGPRPFRVLHDGAIVMAQGSWFNLAGAVQRFTYATEYNRFIDDMRETTAEAISGQQGNMVFRSVGSAEGRTFAARPRMHLPNGALSLVWFNVPWRYVSSPNSYLDGAQGRRPWFGYINQSAIEILGVTYPVGSLMYLGWKPVATRYPAAIDALVPTEHGDIYGVEKFIDVQLNFGLTWRTPRPGTLDPSVPNPNFVRAGWNLHPWLVDRRMHYATSNDAARTPAHYSFPLELLFTDPDFNQVVTNE